jgi:hypothetical protein
MGFSTMPGELRGEHQYWFKGTRETLCGLDRKNGERAYTVRQFLQSRIGASTLPVVSRGLLHSGQFIFEDSHLLAESSVGVSIWC